MSTDSTATGSGAAQSAAPLSPAERSRLAQCFQRGTQNAPTNLDYAIDMYSICVVGDPGNAVYLNALLGVVRRKHAGKKGGGLAGIFAAGSRGGLKKLAAAGKWRDIVKQGVDTIKNNPFDQGTFLALAEAAGNLGSPDAQAIYLRAALDASPMDTEVNKACAAFAAKQGQYDQAIECWRRIAKVKGLAEEAEKEIARLSVEKTLHAGRGMIGRTTPAAKPAAQGGGGAAAEPVEEPPAPSDPIAELKKAITANPGDVDKYLDLADLLERDARLPEAEQMLAKALAVSGNELRVREHVEDRQVRWARNKLMVAERRAQEEDTPENKATAEKLRAALLKQELQVYTARSERYPENLTWKYELAMRLKALGKYDEAIRLFQTVLQDARRKGVVSLELGECFQKIKQYQLAMQNYRTAVEVLTDREPDLQKRALYRAGVLASGLDDLDAARKHLTTLAGLDFGYRDVAQRLDKLGFVKDKGGEKQDGE